MYKLLAYRLSGSTFNWIDGTTEYWVKTIGLEIESWNDFDLNTNQPFIVIDEEDETPDSYVDITSIDNWGKFGMGLLNFNKIRIQLKSLLPESLDDLTESELLIIQEYKLDKYCLIYDYVDYSNNTGDINPRKPPINLDYDIIGLHKKRTLVKGELIKVEYYGEYSSITKLYTKLVLKEDRIYYRENMMVVKREMEIKWYDNEGDICHSKNTLKHYPITESMQELDTRRANLISDLKMNTVGLVIVCSGITSVDAQNLARPLVGTYGVEINKFLQGYEEELRAAITADTIYDWLNLVIPNAGGMTIRQYLISGLTIDRTINNINT